MSNVYGVIENGYCTNIIVAEPDYVAEAEGRYILSTPDNIAWIGAKVHLGKFEKQELPPPVDEEAIEE